jgi:aminoglycoside phosphotransferase (APT) family kinase protein
MRAVADRVAALAGAVGPNGCASVAERVSGTGDAVEVIHSELSLPLRPEHVDDAVIGVAYRISTRDGHSTIVHGTLATKPPQATADDLVITLDDLTLTLRPFPIDDAMPWLAGMSTPAALDAAPPDIVATPSFADAVAHYRPGRRVVVRVERSDGSAIYAKVHAAGRDLVAVANARAIADAPPPLVTAELLGHGAATGTVWTRDAAGTPALDAITQHEARVPMPQIAASLAVLHRTPVDAPTALTPERIVAESVRRARRLTSAEPALVEWCDAVVARLSHALPTVGDIVTLHGDFHPGQIRITDDGPVLLDLDSIRRGEAERDLAEFTAHLCVALGPQHQQVRTIAASLIEGALGAGIRIDHTRMKWYTTAELLQRAYGELKALRPGWPDRARALLELAADGLT